MRAALLRDGCQIISALYNDRGLFPDDEPARPLETCYRDRPRRVETLFGEARLTRRYYHHRPSGTGRCPLDEALGLEGGCSPAVARLMCRAASQSPSYEEGAADLAAYAGLDLGPRDLGRMVASVAADMREALVSLPPAPAPPGTRASIPILYVSADGTGVPMRREALAGRPGKQEA